MLSEHDDFYRISALLSPSYRRLPFLTQLQIDSTKAAVVRKMRINGVTAGVNASILSPVRNVSTYTNLSGRYAEQNAIQMQMPVGEDLMRRELNQYLGLPIVDNNHYPNPILFWLTHADIFPNLFPIAIEYLHVPRSSASCEKVFSAMERTVTPL